MEKGNKGKEDDRMEKQEILTKLLKDDLKPALGVTEPGAIAYAVSLAVQQLAKQSPDSIPERVKVDRKSVV